MQTTLIALFPHIVLFLMYAVVCVFNATYVKLSGKILHGSLVAWKDSFDFSLVVTVLILIISMATVTEGISFQLTPSLALSFVLYLIFGGWFFSTGGFTKQAQPLGWLGGVRLSALAFLLLALIGALVNGVVY